MSAEDIDRARLAKEIANAKAAAARARSAEAAAKKRERELEEPKPEEPETKPWERQAGETPTAFRAFVGYRDLDKRSLVKAAELAKTTRSTVQGWSVRNSWVARVAAWDEHLAAVSAAQAEVTAKTTGELVQETLRVGLRTLRRGYDELLEDPARIAQVSLGELTQGLERLAKLDQLLGGGATERVEETSRRKVDLSDFWESEHARGLLAEARETLGKPARKRSG